MDAYANPDWRYAAMAALPTPNPLPRPLPTASTMLFSNTDTPSTSSFNTALTPPSDSPAPYNYHSGATATRAASLGLFALTTVLGLVAGKRLFKPATLKARMQPAIAAHNTAATAGKNTKVDHTFTTYQNVDSPLLTLAFLSQRKELRGVLGWFGLSSVVGYIGGQALAGMQEAWVRAEETAIRMRGMDAMADTYQQSVHQRNQTLANLKQRTWGTINGWLQQANIPNPERFNPFTSPNMAPNSHQNWQRQLHTNYLLEPRQRPATNFGADNRGDLDRTAAFSLAQPHHPEQAWLSRFSPKQWVPALSALAGTTTGLVLSGFKNTTQQMQGLVKRATLQAGKQEAVTGLFVKNTEALAVLAKQLEAPGLLLTYGMAVGLVTAGKLAVDALREIAVTEENTRTELTYQRYLWQDLGTRLMKSAEAAWLQVQLTQLAKNLPALEQEPTLLRQRIGSIVQGIGLNSAPPHYNTPLNLNITAARS